MGKVAHILVPALSSPCSGLTSFAFHSGIFSPVSQFRNKSYLLENTVQQSSSCLPSQLWYYHSPVRERQTERQTDARVRAYRWRLVCYMAVLELYSNPLPPCHVMPVLLVLSSFSQQLIDVMSCGHSWPCSLASTNKQQRVLCYYRSFQATQGVTFSSQTCARSLPSATLLLLTRFYSHVTCVALT